MRLLLLRLGVAAGAVAAVGGKVISGEYRVMPTEQKLNFLTRFGCAIGRCQYSIRFRVKNALQYLKTSPKWNPQMPPRFHKAEPYHGRIKIFLDEQWEDSEVQALPPCKRQKKARTIDVVRIPPQGNWSVWNNGGLYQSVRPHVWYFTSIDCDDEMWSALGSITNSTAEQAKHLGLRLAANKQIALAWEVKLTQQNGSHFSYEYMRTVYYNWIAFAVHASFLGFLFIRELHTVRHSGMGIHPMLQTLNFAAVCQTLATVCHLMHLITYSKNGYGFWLADMLSDAFAVTSQTVMAALLLLVALGRFLNTPHTANRGVVVPVAFLVVFLQLVAVGLDRLTSDHGQKFHSLEGVLGYGLCAIRAAMWLMFVLAVKTTREHRDCPQPIRTFLWQRLLPAGSLYLLTFPFLQLTAAGWAAYLRHTYILVGTFCMQIASMLWLSSLFINTKSEFFRISELSNSLLPGGFFSAGRKHAE